MTSWADVPSASIDWDDLDESLIPETNNRIDIGSSTYYFRKIHAYDLDLLDDLNMNGDLNVGGDIDCDDIECDQITLDDTSSNPSVDGLIRHYVSGSTHQFRTQLDDVLFSFDLSFE